MQADGSGQTGLPRNDASDGAWSPDGKRIAFVVVTPRPVNRTGTELGLWVVNADGSNPRRVASYAAGSDPAWSPDGRRIAFRRFDGPSCLRHGIQAFRPLCRERRRERAATADTRERGRSFAWSPDGRTIAFLHNREVYIVKADGSDERRLTQLNK